MEQEEEYTTIQIYRSDLKDVVDYMVSETNYGI